MPPSSVPRAAISAIGAIGAAVVVQRQSRRASSNPTKPSSSKGSDAEPVFMPRAAAVHQTAATAMGPAALRSGGRLLAALSSVSTLLAVLHGVWLSVALGAVASWAAVSQKVATTLSQLQLADARKAALADDVIDIATVQQFCGHWVKVSNRSEPMDSFCELFGVPRWLRQATRLMSGLDITVSDDTLVVKQLCRIGWLSTCEAFPLDGSCSSPHKRRDMRGGKQVGRLLSAHDSGMQLTVSFQGALPGQATDTLQLQATPHGSELVVRHEARIDGRGAARFTEVYRQA